MNAKHLIPALLIMVQGVNAQWLNLGPFEVFTTLSSSLNYSTNYDQATEDEIDRRKEEGEDVDDLWLTYGINVTTDAQLFPAIDITFSSGLTFERHFIQEDQDDDSDPLANLNIQTAGDRGHWNYNVYVTRTEELTAEKEDIFIPGETRVSRRERNRTSTTIFGGDLGWTRGSLSLSAGYLYTEERNNRGFEFGDTDEQTAFFNSSWQATRSVSFFYNRLYEKEVLINAEEEQFSDWELTETVGTRVQLLEDPTLIVTASLEKEDDQGEEGEWEPLYGVNFNYDKDVFDNLSVSLFANYNYEEEPETDDITFIFGATLDHQLPGDWSQQFTATREPVDVLGSTADATTTTYAYNLSQPDFLIRSLSFGFRAQREITEPEVGDGLDEEVDTITLNLARGFPISKRWNSTASYVYNWEDSNLIGTSIEHLFIISLNLTL